jgi:hypothetical protein
MGSQKYIKALIAEFCIDTFVISTYLPYFFKNSFLWILFMCEMSFFKSFLEQLTFIMGDNLLLSSSLSQTLYNICKDSKFNPYST